ncbi:hypothetical protein [Nocardia sp. X0981]
MAVRYSKRDRNKYINRVKKLLAQGKSLNAACASVSEHEGGSPATNTLANWVKSAGLQDSTETIPAAPVSPPAERPRRARAAGRPRAAAPEAPVTEPDTEPSAEQDEATANPVDEAVTEQPSTPPAEADTAAPAEPETAPAVELVHVRNADTSVDSAPELDELLDENHRLRTALNEANREIRAMRDLLVVYASR